MADRFEQRSHQELTKEVARLSSEYEALLATDSADPEAYLDSLADSLADIEARGEGETIAGQATRAFLQSIEEREAVEGFFPDPEA